MLERTNEFAVFSFGKGFHGLGSHVAHTSRGQHEFRARIIGGKLGDNHGVILSHGQVKGEDLPSGFLGGFLRPVQPRRAFLNFRSALLRIDFERIECPMCGERFVPVRQPRF
jgi:hypothetical protein